MEPTDSNHAMQDQEQESTSLIDGKDEDARVEIAQRVGVCLTDGTPSQADRRAALMLALALAEDAVERVRCELSEAIKHAPYLPRELALSLAHDVDAVACPFLEATRVFTPRDLEQLVLHISRGARAAVARRTSMPESLARSLVRVCDSQGAETLIGNPATPMTRQVCNTLLDRFASDEAVLDRLSLRDDLLVEIAVRLTTMVSDAVRDRLVQQYQLPGYAEPLAAEAELGAILRLVRKASDKDMVEVAKSLHNEGRLTPSLLLKALGEGQADFLEAGLAVLAERSVEHVRSVVLRAGPDAVAQLLTRACIAQDLHDDFETGFRRIRAAGG